MADSTSIVRVLTEWSGREEFFNIGHLTWKQQTEFKEELVSRGHLVQNIFLTDPIDVMVAKEVRERMEAEKEAQK